MARTARTAAVVAVVVCAGVAVVGLGWLGGSATSALDLPDGWQPVRVGDAVFGVPPRLGIDVRDADDPEPCRNAGPRAALVTASFPPRAPLNDSGALACRTAGTAQPTLVASPLSITPAALLDDPGPALSFAGPWEDVETPVPGQVRTAAPRGPTLEDRLANVTTVYRFPSLDLVLELTTTRADLALAAAIVATVTPAEDVEAEVLATATATVAGEQSRRADVAAAAGDLPEGWIPVRVGDAALGIPGEMRLVELVVYDLPPCPNSVHEPTAFVAAGGYAVATIDENGSVAGCDGSLSRGPAVDTAPLSTVPAFRLGTPGRATTVAGFDAEVRGETGPGSFGQRAYLVPGLDLFLAFSGEPSLDDAVLATVADAR